MKHIHFIGICGVAMSALAIAMKKRGFHVTGSDKGFYPPVSTNLETEGISFYPGWHVDKMTKDGDPDMVVVGNVASSTNPEWLHVKKHDIPYYSYPEFLAEFFIKEHSIVCAGSYGKSSTTTLLTWILQHAGHDPSYMIGGIPKNDIPPAKLSDSSWSVMEGDEYKSARWDMRPKFVHYSPTHLLLTAVQWDHADIYKTERSYIETFQNLLATQGLERTVLSLQAKRATGATSGVTYGNTPEADYVFGNIAHNNGKMTFTITHNGDVYNMETSCLGTYMADNITACFAMAMEIGIPAQTIIDATRTFAYIKRRMEVRSTTPYLVIDDIAHSPEKAKSITSALKTMYPEKKLVVVFEPNTGNRKPEALPQYDGAFDHADEVIIPRLSSVKQSDDPEDITIDGETLTDTIKKTHSSACYLPDDDKLIATLKTYEPGTIIAFLGSHGFRGMIEAVSE